jgi:hypothetical protein
MELNVALEHLQAYNNT